MDPILDRFQSVAATLRPARPRVGWVSNVTGRLVGGADEIDAAYWRRHLREPVRFGDGIRALWSQGCRVFVEIGPGTTLVGMGRSAAPAGEGTWLPSLRRGRPDWTQMLETLAELWIRGVDVDWKGFDRHATRRKVALPTSPFERARYWLAPSSPAVASSSASGRSSGHPLIGRRLRSAVPRRAVRGRARDGIAGVPRGPPRPRRRRAARHRLRRRCSWRPAHGCWAARRAAWRTSRCRRRSSFPRQGRRTVQLVAGPVVDGRMPCEVWSLVADEDRDDAWRLHATATVCLGGVDGAAPRRRARRDPCSLHRGDGAGQAVRGHARARRRASRRVLRASPACGAPTARRSPRCGCPPTSTSRPTKSTRRCSTPACSRSPRCCRTRSASYLPVSIERVERHARPTAPCWSHVTAAGRRDGERRRGRPTSVSSTHVGSLLLAVQGVRLVPAGRDALHRLGAARVRGLLYEITWKPAPIAGGEPAADALPGPRALATAVDAGDRARAGPSRPRRLRRSSRRAWMRWRPTTSSPPSRASGGRASSASASSVDVLAGAARHPAALPASARPLSRDPRGDRRAGSRGGRMDGGQAACRRRRPGRRLEALRARHPEAGAELTLTERCGGALAEVLTGAADPLELLFPGGSTAIAEAFYTASPPARACGRSWSPPTVAAACAGLGARPPSARARGRRRHRRHDGGRAARASRRPDGLPVHRRLPGVHGARRRALPRSAVRADAPARPRARSARPGPRGAELRRGHRGQRRARHARRPADARPLPAPARAGWAAGDARGHGASALDRRHLRPHRRLVALHRSRAAQPTTRCCRRRSGARSWPSSVWTRSPRFRRRPRRRARLRRTP